MSSCREIARELEKRIINGVYPVSSLLPSRIELMREFKVARATLDRAVGILEEKRRVTSRRGSGTTVNPLSEHIRNAAVIGMSGIVSPCSGIEFQQLKFEDCLRPSDTKRLLKYDALIWWLPPREVLPVVKRVQKDTVQVVVNRLIDGTECVSTDHRGAYESLAARRMALYPDAVPVFISGSGTLPRVYRFDGFAAACGKAGKSYEHWRIPVHYKFEEIYETLLHNLKEHGREKLIVMSDSIFITGAFLRAAADAGRRWQKDLWYSDFDNDLPEHIWGIRVSSFIQDYPALFRRAADRVCEILDGIDTDRIKQQLIFPLERAGDT